MLLNLLNVENLKTFTEVLKNLLNFRILRSVFPLDRAPVKTNTARFLLLSRFHFLMIEPLWVFITSGTTMGNTLVLFDVSMEMFPKQSFTHKTFLPHGQQLFSHG